MAVAVVLGSVGASRCMRFAVSTTSSTLGAAVFRKYSGSICACAGVEKASEAATAIGIFRVMVFSL
jgi:hypothetical protein